ncbi:MULTISPECIES: hypothetical protein [Treponema]|uniref:hypothetical protein n=1 Tax=Treponema TaxID=157 RepID=UPI0020A3582F|nr:MULTISPECIES: hypothetical protein [Treponema]UTC61444.1 hypothetical protein E4O05_07705 [Treponema sp. OMZ 787]UTY31093.1 hypothetical protein E4N75_05800 [Treponema putidum]
MVEKKSQISQADLPKIKLEETLDIAQKFHENLAGDSIAFDEIAKLLGSSPNTTKTKYKIWAAEAYGIIKKNSENKYSLSENGRKIVAPTYKEEKLEAIRKSIMTPIILSKFYTDYDKHNIPEDSYFYNILENKYSLPRDRVNDAKDLILENARFAEILIIEANGKSKIDFENKILPSEESKEESSGNILLETNDFSSDQGTNTCFYITPIGDEESECRKHSDMLLKNLIEPVLIKYDIKVIRADKIERSGIITQQILEKLVESKICIADLSFSNPNVFYELGVRHTCKLPTIQIIRKQDKIPFDVSQGRTIIIDTSDVYTLIDRIESAKRELTEYVEEIINNPAEYKENNPISIYLPSLKVYNK